MSLPFADFQFQFPFRKYQNMILQLVEAKDGAQRKFHIVAPPGSGKTIVGIELIRRFAKPAVVFAPTSTIQAQWREKVGLFLPPTTDLDAIATLDPDNLRPINIFTYQLLSTPGENLGFVRELAEAAWLESLVRESKTTDSAPARARIDSLRQNNPPAYEAELRKRYARVKRNALRDPQFDGMQFLHANARALIDRLVGYGVEVLVLDECHHLLDYWALIIKELIRRIPNVRVIGLTATLPGLDSDDEYENYVGLLGDVDFEVPTPAVVKEGNLAPYRDLVYFCRPTQREVEYLRDIQTEFEAALREVTGSPRFVEWVKSLALSRSPELWMRFLDESPYLAIAAYKFLRLNNIAVPDDFLTLDEMDAGIALDDWAALLEPFGLNVLKLSDDPADHAQFNRLQDALLPFGLSLTERGLRQQRAPGDLVLALSEAKDAAVVKILHTEYAALGAQMRAIVITDFEKLSARTRRLSEVLDPDAGSAVRIFRALVADPTINNLDPILVTGQTVLVDADHGEPLLASIRRWLEQEGLSADVSYQPTDDSKVLALIGSGKDWSSRTYVRLITDVFEQGGTRCLVGTRGIFGEGWDALGLNTLIDLTAVTTSTGVNQLRGRSIRLDPKWTRKTAHNWDVVCVAKEFERGDADLRRFARKHSHYWGLVHLGRTDELIADAERAMMGQLLAPSQRGEIRKGVAHVDSTLAFELATREWKHINYDRYTRRMLAHASTDGRSATFDLWGIGEPYSNFSYSATQLDASDIKFVTAFTLTQSLKQVLREFGGTLLASLAWVLYVCIQLAGLMTGAPPVLMITVVCGVPLLIAPFVVLFFNFRSAAKLFKAAVIDMPADAILLDVGKALLAGLRDAALVSANLSNDFVRVHETDTGMYEVFVDYASPEDSDTFTRAYRQLFTPIREPRYLIKRDASTLPDTLLRPLWLAVRGLARQVGDEDVQYHAVPDALGANKTRAESFAAHWQRYVGGGELVYVKSEAGRKVLLQARSKPKRNVKQMAFEIWR